MECKCPNCKETAEQVKLDEVEHINCPECGWFQAQADGTMIVCDPPSSKVDRPSEPAAPEPGPDPAASEPAQVEHSLSAPASTSGGDPHPPPPILAASPPDKPDESDESGIAIEIEFED